MSRRKPAPPPGHGDAWADLIEAAGPDHPLREAMIARRALGLERYGVPLQYGTGLHFDAMAREEILDAAVYLWAGGRRRLAVLMLILAKLEE